MNDEWYLCLTPDWPNRANGLFLPNTNATNNDNRFWFNLAAAVPVQLPPDQPPSLLNSGKPGRDRVGFAIEVTQNINPGSDDFSVDEIAVISSASEQPPRPGSSAATQASPLRQGNGMVCIKSGPPAWILSIGGRTYYALGVFTVHRDNMRTDISAYELSVLAQVSRGARSAEFSYDPEMDVDNNP